MNKIFNIKTTILAAAMLLMGMHTLFASSHREAPLIAMDPLADNTDLYAFRSPDNPSTVTLIANYVPFQLPQGGPNYYHFGENVRYEIHIDNSTATTGDDIIYRFNFSRENEDPTTFFNVRLGAENLKTTYTCERSIDGGSSFTTIVEDGMVPPYNIGERSIQGAAGLDADSYQSLFNQAITTTETGETVFCGPVDDPFFVDLGGTFDLGDTPRQNGEPRDGVGCKNVSSIAIQVPISTLQKDGMGADQADNILDSDFVIGVWASASRKKIRTLQGDGTLSYEGDYVQVSRLGMPLTNEVITPIGQKDFWNSITPYEELNETTLDDNFYNPELALYMMDDQYGSSVPALEPLKIQRNALAFGDPDAGFDFGNQAPGFFPLKNTGALDGTALSEDNFGGLLLPDNSSPRSVDLWPLFFTGVPNLAPYQLATGKPLDNPLADGKPFINNFLPNGGDMLRLNMATPVTNRDDDAFSSEGLIQAAVLGLTDPDFTDNANLEFIPNMDGFPNGRRLEDDVTRIELQAVGGVVMAALGIWYDDYQNTDNSPLTDDLLAALNYSTGVESNDKGFSSEFPYEAMPWSGKGQCSGLQIDYQQPEVLDPTDTTTVGIVDVGIPNVAMSAQPNPFNDRVQINYRVREKTRVKLEIYNVKGKLVKTLDEGSRQPGSHKASWSASALPSGVYVVKVAEGSKGNPGQTLRIIKSK